MGRPKGALNKATKFREHLNAAWDKQGGAGLATRLLKAAFTRAEGFEHVEKTYEWQADAKDPKKRVRVLVKEKVTQEHSTDLLALLLPYMAQQLPRLQELTGKDGAPLVPPAPSLPPLDMSKWTEKQVDDYIAATSAAQAAHASRAAAPAPASPAAP